MSTSVDTRTQLRAICPVCFAQQAVNERGRLAQHGYRRKQGWYQNINTCDGAGRAHFGTAAGRAVTIDHIERISRYALDQRTNAVEAQAGRLEIRDRRKNVITSPMPWQLLEAANHFLAIARNADAAASDLQARVKAWVAVEPVTVTVEAKGAPLVHWRGGYWKDGRACAGSRMAAYTGQQTAQRDHVTCSKCRTYFERYPEAAR